MKQILILEDDSIVGRLWEACIKKTIIDAKTFRFPNVDSVMAEFKTLDEIEDRFDLIIVDVFLAGDITGIQFISNFSKNSQSKVILSSAVSAQELKSFCDDDNLVCNSIQKPFHMNNACELIKKMLKLEQDELHAEEKNKIDHHPEMDPHHLKEKPRQPVIFITGCSTGIGHHLAKILSENKYYRLVLTARTKSIEHVRETFPESDRLMVLPLDVTDLAQVSESISVVLKKWGSIDILINNAGVCYRTVTEQMDFNSEMIQMQTNYLGPMALIRHVIPVMRENGRGKIINISSVSGMLGMPTMGSYSASKHALEGASESLWYELKPFGISVSLVRPGFINSDGHRHILVSHKAKLAEKLRGPYADFYSFMRPFVGRLMNLSMSTSENVAKHVIHLIKKQNPPFVVNATLDAKMFYFLKRLLPQQILRALNYTFFSYVSRWGRYSKAKVERRNILRILLGRTYYKKRLSNSIF